MASTQGGEVGSNVGWCYSEFMSGNVAHYWRVDFHGRRKSLCGRTGEAHEMKPAPEGMQKCVKCEINAPLDNP